MEKHLKDLCDEHGLRAISVMLIPGNGPKPLFLHVHWAGLGNCVSGDGATFDEALSVALRNMADTRQQSEEAA